jgi:hypothetical protein
MYFDAIVSPGPFDAQLFFFFEKIAIFFAASEGWGNSASTFRQQEAPARNTKRGRFSFLRGEAKKKRKKKKKKGE